MPPCRRGVIQGGRGRSWASLFADSVGLALGGRWLQSRLLGWRQEFQLAFIDGVSDKVYTPHE